MAAMQQQPISKDLLAPVMVRCSCGWLACFTESLSDTWVRIQSLEGLPALGEKCEIVFELPDGNVIARGNVQQINGEQRQYTIELTRLDANGELLLDYLVNPAVGQLLCGDMTQPHAPSKAPPADAEKL